MLFWGSRMFRRNIEPSCAYCKRGTRISETEVACVKRGIVPPEDHCRAFRYDPLKRVPPRPAVLRLDRLSEADFSLDDPLDDAEDVPPEDAEDTPADVPSDHLAAGV